MAAWTPNLSWIVADLAVGGSFPMGRARELAERHGVGGVIDLRAEACDDRSVLDACGLAFLHLPTDDHAALEQDALALGVEFGREMRRGGRRLLIHCEHGIGRSATLALCVLTDRGFSPLRALAKAKDARALVSPSPAQYHAWVAWLERWRTLHPADWDIPTFDAFKAIAYRHLSPQA